MTLRRFLTSQHCFPPFCCGEYRRPLELLSFDYLPDTSWGERWLRHLYMESKLRKYRGVKSYLCESTATQRSQALSTRTASRTDNSDPTGKSGLSHYIITLPPSVSVSRHIKGGAGLVTKSCPTLAIPARLLCSWDSPGKNTGMGCHFLLQGIFLTQELNLGLLYCRQMIYQLSHEGRN